MLSAAPVFAQAESDWSIQGAREAARQRRVEARERLQDAREEARERLQDAREQLRERREEWRERREEWRARSRERLDRWRREGREGIHLRVLHNYYLPADATATEPIVVLGGNATIDGRADDDVVVIGGTLRLGPNAVVAGDVVTVGGNAVIDPGAMVRGTVDTARVMPDFDWDFFGPFWSTAGVPWASWWWPVAALSATLLRLTIVLIVSLVLTVLAPGWVRSMGMRAASAVSAGLLGALAEILFVPVLIAIVLGLVISIVGIPLLGAIPVALALGALAWTGGFAAVAACLGARLRGSRIDRSESLVTDVLIGFLAIAGLTILSHVMWMGPGTSELGWTMRAAGIAVEYVAWTIGLGAALSGRVRSQATPPPIPAPSAGF